MGSHIFIGQSGPPLHNLLIRKIVTLQSHDTRTRDLIYKNRLYVYNLALTTLTDQSVVIGIEKKEDKWHEKWGLASLYDNLVPSFLICWTVALQSYDICTIATLQSHDTCTTDLTYKNRLYVYNLALTTLVDQSVVIGIEKKEDKWHEKWSLASGHLLLSCSTVRLQSYHIRTIVTLQSPDTRTTDLTYKN
jgi:hypothetical protein